MQSTTIYGSAFTGREVNFAVSLPEPVNYVDKVLAVNSRLTKENDRYQALPT